MWAAGLRQANMHRDCTILGFGYSQCCCTDRLATSENINLDVKERENAPGALVQPSFYWSLPGTFWRVASYTEGHEGTRMIMMKVVFWWCC